jgi:uncharacterized phage-associated protein
MADRTALKRIEQPITGDRYVSMNYGPVLSLVYDLIKGNEIKDITEIWSKYISSRDKNYKKNSNYTIELLKNPGDDELSEEEVEILNEVYKKYGHIDPFDLAETTHLFPEWENPHGSAKPITVEKILHNIGKNDEQILQISEEVEREKYLDWLVNGQ